LKTEGQWKAANCGRKRMPSSEDYRRKAEECRRLVELTADEFERASHIKMATQWDQLAKRMAEVEAAKEAAKTIKGN